LRFGRTEGVGERPGSDSEGRRFCHGEVAEIFRPSHSPAPRTAAGESSNPCLADALSRQSGPAVPKCGRDALTAPRLAPARVTQSSTSFEVEDWEAARAYFFFRRFVFFAPFFAADFVFVFRFFAMLPS
jgi:hypothetical protein